MLTTPILPGLPGFFVSGDAMPFRSAVNFVIEEEGGYVNNPDDPGGETKYGISKRQYPDLDIASLTKDDAAGIYYRDYWSRLPKLPEPLDFLVFDCAVNCGVGRAIRLLQLAVGAADDGLWGPKSQRALEQHQSSHLVVNYQAERARYYALLDDLDDHFARGWMRRVMRAFQEAVCE